MSTAPFLLAANGQRASHTPVWFMRQAGRSLPEYRALRGDGSILDAIKQPDLAAELTLQPVRRYGVDAAVLYSDIVVPAHAVGFGIDVAPGTGPVCEAPLRTSRRPRRLATVRARGRRAVRAADGEDPRRRTARFGATAGLRRRPVHRRQLPHRGPPEPHLRAHQAADAHRAGVVAPVDGAARPARHRLDRQPARPRGTGVPAVRFVGGHVQPRRLRHLRAAPFHGSLRCARRQPSRLHRASTSASAATTCSSRCTRAGPQVLGLDWRTSIADARRRMGADLVVQGNLDPALVLAGDDVALAGVDAVLGRQRRPSRPHLQPRPRCAAQHRSQRVLQAVVDRVKERTAR